MVSFDISFKAAP